MTRFEFMLHYGKKGTRSPNMLVSFELKKMVEFFTTSNKIIGCLSHLSFEDMIFPQKKLYVLKKLANVIGNLKSGGLNQCFKGMAYKNGRVHPITATTQKLAVIIWNMVTKKEPFNYLNDEVYTSKIRQHKRIHL